MIKDIIKTEIFEKYMREHKLNKSKFCVFLIIITQ